MARAFLTLAGVCMVSSCLDEPDFGNSTGKVKVGIFAGGTRTRTAMLPDGLSAEWVAGDRIAVWALNSSGAYALSQQVFQTYGIDYSRGFFTSTLDAAMADDTYTYYCTYPVPTSVSGTTATFSLPAVQDGKAGGGADIMVAMPVQHGALTTIPDPEDHSGMSMQMNRKMHQFRFWFPQEYDTTGEELLEITLTTPQNIAGNVSTSITDPSASPTLSDGVNSIFLDLAEPVASSASIDDAEFACVSVFPYDGTYTDSDYMNLIVYSQKYKYTVDPISLSGRTFAAGHSTPVRVIPTAAEEYYRLTLKIGDNYIGEHLTNVSVLLDGTNVFYGFDATGEPYSNYTNSVEAYGTDGKAAYDNIISSVQAGTATYIYETQNTLVTRPITTDMMTYDGNRIVVDLGDVPYLLDEDFSEALASAHDDDYSSTSDTNLGGYLLDDVMTDTGWNASRYCIVEGEYIRINCRYEAAVISYARYCGRLDTPSLKYLKSGVSVNVKIEYDYVFQVPAGYNMTDAANEVSLYYLGTHTSSETSALKGVKGNSVDDSASNMSSFGPYKAGSLGNMDHQAVDFSSVGSTTRFVFFVTTNQTQINFLGNNSNYYLYLDNIKVYINN